MNTRKRGTGRKDKKVKKNEKIQQRKIPGGKIKRAKEKGNGGGDKHRKITRRKKKEGKSEGGPPKRAKERKRP